MSEMLRQLKAGEDPDKLDAEYGEELESCDLFGVGAGGSEGLGGQFYAIRRCMRWRSM